MTAPNPSALTARLALISGLEVHADEPLAAHTTYKIGGPARRLAVAHTLAALTELLQAQTSADEPLMVLGNGSNVLVADQGFAGTVLKLGRAFGEAALTRDALGPGEHLLEVGAALSITRLLRLAKHEAIAGVEFLGGVPATVGGAVRMNAGTRLGAVADTLVAAQLVSAAAPAGWVPAARLGLAYRRSALPAGAIVTAARFRCADATAEMRDRLEHVLAYRKSTQPLHLPSCGSVFANPDGDSAGRLIEAAGLKGRRVGGAQVAEQHANWIVNLGGASADDVLALIRLCQAEVTRLFGVALRPEVQLVGDWDERAVTP